MPKLECSLRFLDDFEKTLMSKEGAFEMYAHRALTRAQKHVQIKTQLASAKYVKGYRFSSGAMKAGIWKKGVEMVSRLTYKVGVGFDIKHSKGGYHSIFIAWGTRSYRGGRGTPRDMNLFNAIYAQDREVQQILEEELEICTRL